MSELKAFKMVDEKYCTDCLCVIPSEVYLKSEADKVIAEKDKEIQRLENLCESYRIDCDNIAIRESNAYKEIERSDKKLRHHKYKRCLAMAWWCSAELGMLVSTWESKIKYYKRWQKRWLELAEQFKEWK